MEQLDEEKCLCDVRPFYPMLKVIERKGNTAEKVINAQISCIIGRGLNDESGILQYNEIKQFRRNMRRKCEQIRKEHHSQVSDLSVLVLFLIILLLHIYILNVLYIIYGRIIYIYIYIYIFFFSGLYFRMKIVSIVFNIIVSYGCLYVKRLHFISPTCLV